MQCCEKSMAVKIQKGLRSEKLCANWFIRIYSVQMYQVHHNIHSHSQPACAKPTVNSARTTVNPEIAKASCTLFLNTVHKIPYKELPTPNKTKHITHVFLEFHPSTKWSPHPVPVALPLQTADRSLSFFGN